MLSCKLGNDYEIEGVDIFDGITNQTYELAEACFNTNYYGVKRMIQVFLPLLELSDSARIVNVSSFMGKLKYINNEWAKGILISAEHLTEEKVLDEVLKVFLQDLKEGSITEKGWHRLATCIYCFKSSLECLYRVLAKKYPTIKINCVCPGYVKTDINFNTGVLSVEEGAEGPVQLALMPSLPSGLFFQGKEVSSYE
ncbi:hypothetical protein Dimus_025245 [Dionaea muscipula]